MKTSLVNSRLEALITADTLMTVEYKLRIKLSLHAVKPSITPTPQFSFPLKVSQFIIAFTEILSSLSDVSVHHSVIV